MSAEKPQFIGDGEIESLLTPHLEEESQVIQVGEEKLAELKNRQRELISKKIIPGLESRRKDLGNFCVTFAGFGPKLVVFTTPFEAEGFYLAVNPNGFYKFSPPADVREVTRAFLEASSGNKTYRIEGVYNERKWRLEYLQEALRFDLKEYVTTYLGDWWSTIETIKLEKADFDESMNMLSDRIHELEEKKVSEARMYESDEHPDVIEMKNRIQRLEDLSAMLPEPESIVSKIKGSFSKFKKK